MSGSYYIRRRGLVQGPFEVEKLKVLARRGRFAIYDDISEDRAQWMRVSAHPTLAAEIFQSRVGPKVRAVEGIELEQADFVDEQSPGESEDTYGLTAATVQAEPLWHYMHGGKSIGPVDLASLQRLISIGELAGDALVWTDGMSDWRPANQLPQIFSMSGPAYLDAASPKRKRKRRDEPELPRTSSLAIASLILSLLGTNLLFFLGSLIGVVFGHIALREIDNSNGRVSGRAMAVTGLVLGYAMLAFTILIGIVLLVLAVMAANIDNLQ